MTLPSRTEPIVPVDRAGVLERTSRRSRVLTLALPAPFLDAHSEAISEGTQRFEVVVTPEVVETMAELCHVSLFTDILSSDQANVYVYDDTIPDVLGINDGVVYFGIDDDRGAPVALIETDDEVVCARAEEMFESYRDRSSRLTHGRFFRVPSEGK